MMSALVSTLLGVCFSYWMALRLSVPMASWIQMVLGAILAGFFSLFLVIFLQGSPRLRSWFVPNAWMSWLVLAVSFLGSLYVACFRGMDIKVYLYMIPGLILCTGISIVLYGPIRDYQISKRSL